MTCPVFTVCTLSWAQEDSGHTGDSPHGLSVKCFLLNKEFKNIAEDSKVHSDFTLPRKKNSNFPNDIQA